MKESSINKFFAKTSEEAKKVKEVVEKRFGTQERVSFVSERPKNGKELEVLAFLDAETGAMAEKFGGEALKIAPKNIHIIGKEEFADYIKKRSVKDSQIPDASFNINLQAVVMKDTEGDLVKFINVLMHEMYHCKAFQSLRSDLAKKSLSERRVGLSINLRNMRGGAFLDLDEAVTEYLIHLTIDRWTANKRNLPPAINETIENFGEPDIYTPTYLQEQLRFINILDEMLKKNLDEFKDREGVFGVFAKSYFTGKLLRLSKLIDKTFGKGSFISFAKEGLPESRWER